ncbi:iron chaperone [Draconibacterium mangrovi]|uniref:iron chaperone n=1 Tax=Draconibacterium mangrovi TaxID=2697469 RepID=UPI0013D0BE88|nr:DUF1801 domain-containing protein [Draconibacterium mangrovi]
MKKIDNVDAYISGFPTDIQDKLIQIREIIRENAPDAIEGISYGMPAYKLNKKPLVYFGGYEKHIGFYATPTGHERFKNKLAVYKQGKGSVQFPNKQALPLDLIAEIVKFRVEESKQMK